MRILVVRAAKLMAQRVMLTRLCGRGVHLAAGETKFVGPGIGFYTHVQMDFSLPFRATSAFNVGCFFVVGENARTTTSRVKGAIGYLNVAPMLALTRCPFQAAVTRIYW